MKKPKPPPSPEEIFSSIARLGPKKLDEIFTRTAGYSSSRDTYPHWDKLVFLKPPAGMTHQEWWFVLKQERRMRYKQIPLEDKGGNSFIYTNADPIPESLHKIDLRTGGAIQMPEQIINPDTKDRYYVQSLMDEAITSSQLEGATTTRRVAQEMLRQGRRPRDRSEQMIMNNYETMRAISEFRNEPLTSNLIFQLHKLVTHDTLEDPSAAGRFRRQDEKVVVADDSGEVFHDPPLANELKKRMTALCRFANQETPKDFIHPVIRAIMLHFWIGYDHPFVEGNGRTARAVFYWAMLRYGYWLCEYISISKVILKGPSNYARAFLYTETDQNDLTYFILYHLNIINRAVEELEDYIKQQVQEVRIAESKLRKITFLNHRQRGLITHALRHPGQNYTIYEHQRSNNVTYQTARTDLLGLQKQKLLEAKKIGKRWYFSPVENLEKALS